MDLNKAMIIGRLTQMPEKKVIPSGQTVCTFSVATNRVWTNQGGEKQEQTEFHNIVIWGKQAETFNQYMSKGKECYVEGELTTRSWDDKQGNKRYTTEVNVNHFQFISNNADKNGGLKKAYDKNESADYKISTNDDFTSDSIPF